VKTPAPVGAAVCAAMMSASSSVEETKGRRSHWSLEQPRHLFVFGFHGATAGGCT